MTRWVMVVLGLVVVVRWMKAHFGLRKCLNLRQKLRQKICLTSQIFIAVGAVIRDRSSSVGRTHQGNDAARIWTGIICQNLVYILALVI